MFGVSVLPYSYPYSHSYTAAAWSSFTFGLLPIVYEYVYRFAEYVYVGRR